MRPSARAVVLILSIAAVITVTTGASGTPGAGGWDQVGQGSSPTKPALNGSVLALVRIGGGDFSAGGTFTAPNTGSASNYISVWAAGSASGWNYLPNSPGQSGLNGSVTAMAYRPNHTYVGGTFTNAGGNANAAYLAQWNGLQQKWETVCNGLPLNGSVDALQIIGNTIYIGGTFKNGAGVAKADDLLACDLTTGAPRSTVKLNSFNGTVYALAADSNGRLYAGGTFSSLDGQPTANFVAYLDGGTWHAMTSGPGQKGVTGIVRSLAASGTNVFVGTDALDVGGIPQADHVAKWNGSSWSALGSKGADGWFPASTYIYALTTYGAGVYAGGSFANAGGNPLADRIAFYDGHGWVPVGSNGAGDGPLNGTVNALAVFGNRLYAGGNFTSAGGNLLAQHIASAPLPPKPLVAH